MSLPRYPKYKNSGVEWLGRVPEHWEVRRLGDLTARIGSGKTPRGGAETYTDQGVAFIRSQNVYDEGLALEDVVYVTAEVDEELRTSRVLGGDILINITGASIGRTCLVPAGFGPANVNQHVCVIRLNDEASRVFVSLALKSRITKGQIDAAQTGAAREGLNYAQVSRLLLAMPPPPEQTVISSFLDRETATIDALISEQRRLVGLLKEKRQAVISYAVTKGLNPDAPMKPSGIEGLDEVPAHWEVSKMKWAAKMESGHTPDKKVAAYWDGGTIPWVSLNDTGYLKDHDYITDTAYQITEQGISNSSAHLLPARAVVVSRDATIGRCAITTRPMAVSQHFIGWVCHEDLRPEYLLLRLRSMTDELERLATGATLKTIGMPEVRTLATPVPPVDEQDEIVAFVAAQSAKCDSLTGEAQRAIELLQERRGALVSAAVTGQVDVRQFAHEQPA